MKTKSKISLKRDNNWLLSRLDFIWTKYFSDIPQTNRVFIRFGRFAKLRLGSIRLNRKSKDSFILITSMFKDESVPQSVVDHTIAHELIHYTHGFSSNRLRMHKYPHAGGVVKNEMVERGMGNLYTSYRAWIKDYRKILRKVYGF